jgi:hypothetical protein
MIRLKTVIYDGGQISRRYVDDFNGPALDPAMAAGGAIDRQAITVEPLFRKIIACRTRGAGDDHIENALFLENETRT